MSILIPKILANKELQKLSDEQITVADLTGFAIQDIQISKAVYKVLRS
ncbi:MAG: hypothetical protein KAT41_02565 [Candidatus Marinimicrobia bacterium]|nr:hypothetical protein [Candidatus Neomarinimicrobiota bacterium]MCK4689159.1 hypothetical protein [Candidatus Neomarinimicrobiota bacterium]